MSDPNPPPGYQQGTSGPPPPPMWVPMPAPGSRGIPWNTLAILALMIGFVLVFLGTVVVVAVGSPLGSCGQIPPTCDLSGWHSGLFNAVWAGKMLWTFGLAGVGAGSGIKLHWGPKVARGAPAEEYNFVSAERRRYTLLFIVSVVLLAIVMLTVNSLPPTIPG